MRIPRYIHRLGSSVMIGGQSISALAKGRIDVVVRDVSAAAARRSAGR